MKDRHKDNIQLPLTVKQGLRACLLIAVTLGSMTRHAYAAPQYRVIELGTFASGAQAPSGQPNDINDQGRVVGQLTVYASNGSPGVRAAMWTDPFAPPTNLGDIRGLNNQFSLSQGSSVNASGLTVGTSFGSLPGISGAPQVAAWWTPRHRVLPSCRLRRAISTAPAARTVQSRFRSTTSVRSPAVAAPTWAAWATKLCIGQPRRPHPSRSPTPRWTASSSRAEAHVISMRTASWWAAVTDSSRT